MLGWKLFKHALMMVLRNIMDVLKIGLVPIAIGFCLMMAILLSAGLSFNDGAEVEDFSIALAFIPAFFIFLFCTLWVLVLWHRFVLLEELPNGWFNKPPAQVWNYLGRLIVIALLGIVAMVPAWILMIMLSGVPVLLAAVVFVYILFVALLFLRISIILPAAAIGQPLALSDALSKTEGHTGTLVVMMLCFVGLQILVQILVAVFGLLPIIGAVVGLAASMIFSMVNASMLTTMYGYFVENRNL